jgi:hypothetical protein
MNGDFSEPFALSPPSEPAVWVDFPDGYTALPLDGLDSLMEKAAPVLVEEAPPELRDQVAPVLETLAVLLAQLAARNVLYCGLGRHLDAVTGEMVTSTLTVSHLGFPSKSNPRVLLARLLQAGADAGDAGHVDLVDLGEKPALIRESVTRIDPRTALAPPGDPPPADPAPSVSLPPVFQLQALVPAPDGTAVVMVEVSTPAITAGPQFRTLFAAAAASVRFTAPS